MNKTSSSIILFFAIIANGFSANLYWIGGTGNWSDATHWSNSSGGSTSAIIPNQTYSVVFDANSFPSGGIVTINQLAYCKDMAWTGVTNIPTLAGNSELDIYGSLTLTNSMNLTYTGQLHFKSNSTTETIATLGKIILSNIYFDGLGGGWTLQDSLVTNQKQLYHYNGTLNTNGKYVFLRTFESSSSGVRTLNLSFSTIVVTGTGSPSAFSVVANNCTMNAGTSQIKLTGGGGQAYFYGGAFNYYDVSFTDVASTTQGMLWGGSTFHNVSFASNAQIGISATYNDVTIAGNGTLNGSNTFNNLTLSPGKTYTPGSGTTQTFIGNLTANGTCAAPIELYCTSGFSTFSKSSGAIIVDYVRLLNIHTSGGASFTTNNATDFGGNTGWALNTTTPQTLYWIGNTGNWSDATHWSTSSGGSISNCIPSIYDNVIFDGNSFLTGGGIVTVNQVAYCKDMAWTGAANTPTLAGNSELDIYGSLTLTNSMNLTYTGQLHFKSNSTTETIATLGKIILSNIYFDGLGGGWTLQDSLVTNQKQLYHYNGTLNTNGKYVFLRTFESSSSGVRTLNLSFSTIVVTGTGSPSAFSVVANNCTMNAGTSQIKLTGGGGQAYFYGGAFNYYDVSFTDVASTTQGMLWGGSTFHNVSFASNAQIGISATYNDVTIAGNGTLNGSNTFNNLTLSPGKTYTPGSGTTQTFIGNLTANGTCAAPIELYCTSGFSTFSKSSGAIIVDYVRLLNIHTSGGASFTTNNATDFGGNTGWALNTTTPQTLYWIGNTGNWSDATHWSTSSGGSISNCIPSIYDNVIFDGNSFLTGGGIVTVNQVAYCKDMIWTGAANTPTLAGNSELDIYGSLTLTNSMNLTYTGQLHFKSNSTTETIATLGKIILSNIYFDGLGGGWTLQDSLVTNQKQLYHYNGTLNTNGKYVFLRTFESSSSGVRTLNLSFSTIVVTGTGSPSAFSVVANNCTMNAGTSQIKLTGGGGQAYFYGGAFNYYDVSFTDVASTTQGMLWGGSTFHNVSFASNAQIGISATYNDVTIAGNGTLNGSNTFNNLTLSPGKTYTPGSGTTQTFIGNLTANGTGALPITIHTTSSFSTFSKISSSVCTDWLILNNIHATGGAIFDAGINSVDQGNNNGWNFINCTGNPPSAAFSTTPVSGITPLVVQFTDASTFAPTSWNWSFPGGSPSSSSNQNPTVVYFNPGSFSATLVASNVYGNNTLTMNSYIDVNTSPVQGGISLGNNVHFGNVLIGNMGSQFLSITNNSAAIVHISSLSLPTEFSYSYPVSGQDILPNHTIYVTITFSPSITQLYSGTGTINCNAINNPVSFQISGTGVGASVSWFGAYNKQVNHPSIKTLSALTSNYVNAISVSQVRLCADGSKATVLKYYNGNPSIITSNIRFKIKSDPATSNPDYYGKFSFSDYTFNGDTVTAKYTHPIYLNVNSLYRLDTFQVVNNVNSSVLYQHQLKVFRAPVLMIHGLWGAPSAFDEMKSYLLGTFKYYSQLVYTADYHNTNADWFFVNDADSNVIGKSINNVLNQLRGFKISAGKVDVVAHSMGGVLSRMYLQRFTCNGNITSYCYQNDIHKLITVNTPHSGTQIANFLLSNDFGAQTARTFLSFNDQPINLGAIDDLKCNSSAIQNDLNGPGNLNSHVVPSFAISSTKIANAPPLSNEDLLIAIVALCSPLAHTPPGITNIIFNGAENDVIVPDSSQRGGLISYVNNYGNSHTQNLKASNTLNQLNTLLDENPNTNSDFTDNSGGYNPPSLYSQFRLSNPNPDTSHFQLMQSGLVNIISPLPGLQISNGSTIPITVTGSPTVNKFVITAGNSVSGISYLDTSAANSIVYNYTVPSNFSGELYITAFGFDTTSWTTVDYDTLKLLGSVPPTISVFFQDLDLFVPKSQTMDVSIFGLLPDSSIINLTGNDSVQYTTSNPSVFTFNSVNSSALGVDTGIAVLHAHFRTLDAYLLVHVYNADTGSITGIIHFPKYSTVNENQTICHLLPNIVNREFQAEFDESANRTLYVVNAEGKAVLEKRIASKSDWVNVSILSQGLYLVRIIDEKGNTECTGKFIKE